MISYTSLIELQQNIFTEAEKMKVKNAEELYINFRKKSDISSISADCKSTDRRGGRI